MRDNAPHGFEIPIQILKRLNFAHVKKYKNHYITCLQENIQDKVFIVMTSHHNVKLKKEELLWLELLIIYVNSFIGNAKVIEELSN
ncbi:hypothetical protein AEA09_06510 [Lysinibacillus contaminans]|uniref:Uncharacterized protein n=1 Tax=Lysinibacillus contaminans TaxID=1293441 RepID=A0ABR5K023_9BACI|nr:hypothetical protein [Lysinibacillus contaminans]KOS68241.1 hypothetical protein AEA09_06510 [Lysinibacillus contaminans]